MKAFLSFNYYSDLESLVQKKKKKKMRFWQMEFLITSEINIFQK